jgi:hypothetical protein
LLTAVGLRSLLLTRPQRVLSLPSALLTSAVALSKPFYLPLSLIGAQPFTGGRFQPHRLWSGIVTCSLAVALPGAWVHLNAPIAVPPWSGIPPVGERLAAALHQPLLFPAVLARTYILHGPKLFATLFQFGWLNVSAGFVSIVLTVLALHSVLTAGEPSHQRLRRLDRIWILALVAASILLISLAAWVYGTPAQLDWIFGLQGRYFIPLFPAAFVAALPNRKSSPAGTHRVAILMIAANLFTLGSIAQAFYR